MLKSLKIRNFRALEDFEVSRLGRVNLIVGKNNFGKSSVLEALRIYAGNAQLSLLEQIAAEHDERSLEDGVDLTGNDRIGPFSDLFTGRQYPSDGHALEIGDMQDEGAALVVEAGYVIEHTASLPDGGYKVQRRRASATDVDPATGDIPRRALFIRKNGRDIVRPLDPELLRNVRANGIDLDKLPCSVIPTQFVSLDELADAWDDIVLTPDQDILVEAMRFVTPEFKDIAFVRKEKGGGRDKSSLRSAKVRLSSAAAPISLYSLGDGAQRVLQLVLKTISAKGGFLLIDEFENGLHYSVQEKVWNLIFELADRLEIQVFATTHSWDCVESFAKVAQARTDIEGVLFRVGRSVRTSDKGKVIATVFNEDELYNVTQADVEVR